MLLSSHGAATWSTALLQLPIHERQSFALRYPVCNPSGLTCQKTSVAVQVLRTRGKERPHGKKLPQRSMCDRCGAIRLHSLCCTKKRRDVEQAMVKEPHNESLLVGDPRLMQAAQHHILECCASSRGERGGRYAARGQPTQMRSCSQKGTDSKLQTVQTFDWR